MEELLTEALRCSQTNKKVLTNRMCPSPPWARDYSIMTVPARLAAVPVAVFRICTV